MAVVDAPSRFEVDVSAVPGVGGRFTQIQSGAGYVAIARSQKWQVVTVVQGVSVTMGIDEGNVATVAGEFRMVATKALVDPTTVRVIITRPDHSSVIYNYGTDAQVIRDGQGKFHVDLDTSGFPGDWRVRWQSTGVGQASDDVLFTVRGSDLR